MHALMEAAATSESDDPVVAQEDDEDEDPLHDGGGDDDEDDEDDEDEDDDDEDDDDEEDDEEDLVLLDEDDDDDDLVLLDEDDDEDDEPDENDGDEEPDDDELDVNADMNAAFVILRSGRRPLRGTSQSRTFWNLLRTSNDDPHAAFDQLPIEAKLLLVHEATRLLGKNGNGTDGTTHDEPSHVTATSNEMLSNDAPIEFRVLLSQLPDVNKRTILSQLRRSDTKYLNWVKSALRLPLGMHAEPTYTREKGGNVLRRARTSLDEVVYGHKAAKHKVVQYIGELINAHARNKTSSVVLGIHGPMGNGKTTLVEKGLSNIIGLPFASIALGGATDSTVLTGHSYTYEGSMYGKIVDVLMRTRCMNPIIYLDELDKVSDTPRGQEIVNTLIHLVDPCQNHHYRDNYFSDIDIDLSKVTWIFSYNDRSRINRILLDRITEVQTHGFSSSEKIQIARMHLLPRIYKSLGGSIQPEWPDDVLHALIQRYTHEAGVRRLNELLTDVCRDINLQWIEDEGSTVVGSSRPTKRRRRTVKTTVRRMIQLEDFGTNLLRYQPRVCADERIPPSPVVGTVVGLYATTSDLGGVLPIEVAWKHASSSERAYNVELTGNVGKIMEESCAVAKTVVWGLLTVEMRKEWAKIWKQEPMALHVHCPEGATSKDGPSAGAAISTAIASRLLGACVRNDVGVTGEINLAGDVLPIGGLGSKIAGAKRAGCTEVLFPADNADELEYVRQTAPEVLEQVVLTPVKTVRDVLARLLVPGTYKRHALSSATPSVKVLQSTKHKHASTRVV